MPYSEKFQCFYIFIYFQKITNTPITISEEEEEIDMCQAVDEMIEDGRNICRRDGKSG